MKLCQFNYNNNIYLLIPGDEYTLGLLVIIGVDFGGAAQAHGP